ncbi:hypothetical protein [Corynebacterium macclintockiae]|uniref:hypothetical protein n=1 Tax=Corynebacterium macclintockiae TaxID=2913501 RepID=UPI003EBCB75F
MATVSASTASSPLSADPAPPSWGVWFWPVGASPRNTSATANSGKESPILRRAMVGSPGSKPWTQTNVSSVLMATSSRV